MNYHWSPAATEIFHLVLSPLINRPMQTPLQNLPLLYPFLPSKTLQYSSLFSILLFESHSISFLDSSPWNIFYFIHLLSPYIFFNPPLHSPYPSFLLPQPSNPIRIKIKNPTEYPHTIPLITPRNQLQPLSGNQSENKKMSKKLAKSLFSGGGILGCMSTMSLMAGFGKSCDKVIVTPRK